MVEKYILIKLHQSFKHNNLKQMKKYFKNEITTQR